MQGAPGAGRSGRGLATPESFLAAAELAGWVSGMVAADGTEFAGLRSNGALGVEARHAMGVAVASGHPRGTLWFRQFQAMGTVGAHHRGPFDHRCYGRSQDAGGWPLRPPFFDHRRYARRQDADGRTPRTPDGGGGMQFERIPIVTRGEPIVLTEGESRG